MRQRASGLCWLPSLHRNVLPRLRPCAGVCTWHLPDPAALSSLLWEGTGFLLQPSRVCASCPSRPARRAPLACDQHPLPEPIPCLLYEYSCSVQCSAGLFSLAPAASQYSRQSVWSPPWGRPTACSALLKTDDFIITCKLPFGFTT